MAKKSTNAVDVHVGSRMRLRRMLVGMSQEKMGEHLGLTFQQVQKYEKGANRIGASRLFHIALTLGVPVQFFYEDLPGQESARLRARGFGEDSLDETENLLQFVSTAEGVQLNRAFVRIRDTRVRRRILELIQDIADSEKG